MTFSQDNFLERGQGGSSQKPEDGIFSNNFGGLNKTASSLNVPFEDSPDLLNVDVDVAGNIKKRKGTKVVSWNNDPGTVGGVSIIPFTTGLGYNFLVNKNGNSLSVLEVIDDKATQVITKANVFPTDASSIRINYVATSEIEPRLIITTGITPPVQLKFVEQQQVFTGTSTTTVIIQNAQRFATANASNIVFFKDRVRQPGVSVSYNATLNQLTVSGLSLFTGTFTFDIVLIVWQWWAEAYYYLGDRFSSTSTRTNSPAVIDKVVAIPASLRDGAVPTEAFPQIYPIYAYRSTDFGSAYDTALTGTPLNRSSYAHCDGVPYNGQGVCTPSPLFISFGDTADTATSCDASNVPRTTGTQACPSTMPVVFERRRKVNFNGGRGWLNNSIRVYVDGRLVQFSFNTTTPVAGYGTAYYTTTEGLEFRISTNATVAWGISFTASQQVGLPSNSKVEICNPNPQFLGTGANNNRGDEGTSINTDGSWVPAFGFGDFANYGSGSFPTNVALYQGRLVFSGFLDNSLRVLFSNQYDSVVPGLNFAHYQIDSVASLATDAFDITLSSSPDDITKALIEWQQSLFVMTRKAVFRVYGGSNSAITSTTKLVVLVSNIGLINSYSVCRTDKSILYLSDTGIFDLSTSIDSPEYVAGDKSLKIRPYFGIASNPQYEALSWLAFDSTHKVVFFAYPEEGIANTAYRLFVYNTFRESWTEYYTPGGFNSYHGVSYIDRSSGSQFGIMVSTYRNKVTNVALDLMLIRTNYDKYIDYAQVFVGTGESQLTVLHPFQRCELTTIDKVREYAFNRSDTNFAYGVRSMPMTDIPDITVFLEISAGSGTYRILTFDVEYKKTPNGKIYLLENPGTGRKLFIDPNMPVNKSQEGSQLYSETNLPLSVVPNIVFVDNVMKLPKGNNFNYSNQGVAFGGTAAQIRDTYPLNSVVVVGQAYPTYYHSPMFTKESLASLKRSKYVYAFFDNTEGLPTYTKEQVNTASGQAASDFIGTVKQRLNANISIKYEDDDYAETSYDNYGYNTLMWDDALFDIYSPTVSYRKSVLFKQALLGISYSYQLIVWSYDETTFTLAGYQIVANIRGSRYINWSK